MHRPLFACGVLLALTALVYAEDWPEFRGPTGQGISKTTGLPAEWSTTKNVAWNVKIPGTGWSSPVVVGGRVYLTTAVTQNKALRLEAICLDAKDGKLVWETDLFQPDAASTKAHGKNSQASPTPVVHGGRLYVHFGHMGTACLDLDGKVIWKNTDLAYSPVHGNGGSPVVVDDRLVFSCDGASVRFVVALDCKTGEVVWKKDRETTPVKSFSFCTPLVIDVNGKKQVVSPGSDIVSSHDPKTGDVIWFATYNGYSVVPRPVYGHGMVFLSTGFDAPVVMAIRADGKGDVTKTHVVWKREKEGPPNTPSLLLDGDDLYMVSDGGLMACVDAKTGAEHWQKRAGGPYSASPVLADGKIYLQTEKGTGVVLQAGKTFEQLAKNDMGEKTLASYAIADGAIFLRTETQLYRIQEMKGR